MPAPADGLQMWGPEERTVWLPIVTARGDTIGQLQVRVAGTQLLRLLHAANKFRVAEASGLGGLELSTPRESVGEGGASQLDMVEELYEPLLAATLRHAATKHELCVTAFFMNPAAAQLVKPPGTRLV